MVAFEWVFSFVVHKKYLYDVTTMIIADDKTLFVEFARKCEHDYIARLAYRSHGAIGKAKAHMRAETRRVAYIDVLSVCVCVLLCACLVGIKNSPSFAAMALTRFG